MLVMEPDATFDYEPPESVVVETWYAFGGHDHVLAVRSKHPGSSHEREAVLKEAHRLWGEGRKNEQTIVAIATPGGKWQRVP